MAKKKDKSESFATFYENLFGLRWIDLKKSLEADIVHFELNQDLKKSYYLDEASVIAAKMLEVQKGDSVLDVCAAPGGKALVLATQLKGSGILITNDLSSARRYRMQKVFKDHLAEDLRKVISTKGINGIYLSKDYPEHFDKILLDAPCSSERHVINNPKYLNQWSPTRIKRLSNQQYLLLRASIRMLKSGGTLVYSTCAINPKENDLVIQRILKKEEKVKLTPDLKVEMGEKTEFGWEILPDKCLGKGPIYFSKIQKV